MRDGPAWRAIAGILRLLRDLRRRRFDATSSTVHGFRETNLLTWWSGAPERWGLKRFDQSFFGFCFNRPPVVEDKSLHASESFIRDWCTALPPSPQPADPSDPPSGSLGRCLALGRGNVLPSKPFVRALCGCAREGKDLAARSICRSGQSHHRRILAAPVVVAGARLGPASEHFSVRSADIFQASPSRDLPR